MQEMFNTPFSEVGHARGMDHMEILLYFPKQIDTCDESRELVKKKINKASHFALGLESVRQTFLKSLEQGDKCRAAISNT